MCIYTYICQYTYTYIYIHKYTLLSVYNVKYILKEWSDHYDTKRHKEGKRLHSRRWQSSSQGPSRCVLSAVSSQLEELNQTVPSWSWWMQDITRPPSHPAAQGLAQNHEVQRYGGCVKSVCSSCGWAAYWHQLHTTCMCVCVTYIVTHASTFYIHHYMHARPCAVTSWAHIAYIILSCTHARMLMCMSTSHSAFHMYPCLHVCPCAQPFHTRHYLSLSPGLCDGQFSLHTFYDSF